MDHVNPNVGIGFNLTSNLQVLHASCNREKSAMSVQDQAKRLGVPFTAILNGGKVLDLEEAE
jgi:hypothetical protein